MESIKKILPVPSPQPIQNPKSYKFLYNQDDPDYKEPSPEEKRKEWLLKWAGVTDLNNTFDKMRVPNGFIDTLESFKKMAIGEATWHILLVYGGTGNGKSRCCEATVIDMYDKRHLRVMREKWSDIVRFTLKASFGKQGNVSYEETFKKLREKPYLIIDDIGMGSTGGNWEWGELEDIVDYRLEHGLFTIMTTNLDIKSIPPRIVSRLRDAKKCKLVYNKAPDQRMMGVK